MTSVLRPLCLSLGMLLCGAASAQAQRTLTLPPPAVSALAVEVSGALSGQLVNCPRALSVPAACLYVAQPAPAVQATVRSRLGTRAQGDWKAAGAVSSLVVQGNSAPRYILVTPLGAAETLVILGQASAPAPAVPAGVVRGQPYVLDRDLVGVVDVQALGGGQYRLTPQGGQAVVVTAGQSRARRGESTVDLLAVPVTDGQRLIVPVPALRALGCTLSPTGSSLTVACGSGSVGVRPIVF
ncbi:hypothetical protein ACFP81_03625 [Deinococcus lacus]|uniref:Uncharacterized protein n=1 Tax=Deinococcus lacus TaxID=392561 RepID=A0ABW1YCP5_9DEIO